MDLFIQHTTATASQEAAQILTRVNERYGFIPNLAAYLAESAVALDALLVLANAFDKTSLTPQEQQVVLLTISILNGCDYCKTAHTGLGYIAGVDGEILQAVIALEPLPAPKLNSLCQFTRKVVEQRGWVTESDVQTFLDAGYTKANVFEVVLGTALKTLTNYTNHITGSAPNPEFLAMYDKSAIA